MCGFGVGRWGMENTQKELPQIASPLRKQNLEHIFGKLTKYYDKIHWAPNTNKSGHIISLFSLPMRKAAANYSHSYVGQHKLQHLKPNTALRPSSAGQQ